MAVKHPEFKDTSIDFPLFVYASFCSVKTNTETQRTAHGIVRVEVVKSITATDIRKKRK